MRLTDQIEHIKSALALPGKGSSDFDLHPDLKLPPNRKLRPAAVLVPLVFVEDRLDVILTKRSSALKHHPGQIAFPGGKVDDADKSALDAALREANEEIGLPQASVSVLGELAAHETVTGFSVTPVVGLINDPFDFQLERQEVEEAFMVPFDHVTQLDNFSHQGRIWQGSMRMYETVPFGPYYIWGATARMLKALAEQLTA